MRKAVNAGAPWLIGERDQTDEVDDHEPEVQLSQCPFPSLVRWTPFRILARSATVNAMTPASRGAGAPSVGAASGFLHVLLGGANDEAGDRGRLSFVVSVAQRSNGHPGAPYFRHAER
jgi:hypothetical protein